mmetsp:Transcript_2743/g.3478  ORF Transcript_2743/g.3478 Transcript_2743/m.3478 type:complete len:95 (-) Transcript_2743:277-561(-)
MHAIRTTKRNTNCILRNRVVNRFVSSKGNFLKRYSTNLIKKTWPSITSTEGAIENTSVKTTSCPNNRGLLLKTRREDPITVRDRTVEGKTSLFA